MDVDLIASGISPLSIAVIGDLCLDSYFFLQEAPGEISIETGKATRVVERHTFDGGGGANVALNLKKLGVANVDLFGVVGDDGYALILDDILRKAGVCNRAVVQSSDWSTYVYNKFYTAGVEEPRVDIGNYNKVRDDTIDALLSGFLSRFSTYDAVIINQQIRNGLQTKHFQAEINRVINNSQQQMVWVCDCRDLNDVYRATIHKLNGEEALRIYTHHRDEKSIDQPSENDLIQWLHDHWKKEVVMTRGENGALITDGKNIREVLGIHIINQVDTVGAGDAFLAAFTACFAARKDPFTAAEFANLSASVAVQKIFQTGHPTIAEIKQSSVSTDYRYHPELAENHLAAHFLAESEVEIISKPSSKTPRVAIFDHDGTISTLRIGWERVMEAMMIRSILGGGVTDLAPQRLNQVNMAVKNLIARTTGVQTLLQMHALVKLVHDFGHVAKEEVLSPAEYKAIYNRELLQLIRTRTQRVRNGSLSVADVTIKGAVDFLRRLSDSGITLYLASGTDVEDVIQEAKLLGYADLFTGGIYGSVGNIDKDPKRLVFEQIFDSLARGSATGDNCVVFGDGPVELREGKKFGATAIGVVSDERQRYGINLQKRNRLVLAGADLLIPDFSWNRELFEYLQWEI
jgi:rfaE bifunctional protein kinase chain/domain